MHIEHARDELTALIMKRGNPEYYVWHYVLRMSADDLAAELYDFLGEEVTVEDEE